MTIENEARNGLTAEERERYEKDGYFIRPDAFTASEMDDLRGLIEDLVELVDGSDVLTNRQKEIILKRPPSEDPNVKPPIPDNIYRLHTYSAAVRKHIRDPRRLDVGVDMVGPDLFCPNDLFFFKPPGTGRPIAWHQDSWYFRNTYVSSVGEDIDEATLGTWLALDDADEENGCMWVLPGTHADGIVDHSDVESGEYILQKRVFVDDEMEERAVPVVVPKGALVFFNNALLHRSTPNRSDRFRRAYVVHYMKATIQHTERGRWIPPGAENWGTPEMYISGKQYPSCVQTTQEHQSMNWDNALGGTLSEDDIHISD